MRIQIPRKAEFAGGGAPSGGAGSSVDSNTHGMAQAGATVATVVKTTVGSAITLPAGGPWKIFYCWVQAVPQTYTAAEAVSGVLELNAVSGDLNPDPAPFNIPAPAFGSRLGATGDVPVSPLQLVPIAYTAPGKAVIELNFTNDIAVTAAPIVAAGIIFGKTVPVPTRMLFTDRVRTTVTSASLTSVGTITLAEKAKKITAICGILNQGGVLTTAEELIGTFQIDSDDMKMTPGQYPCSAAFGAGLGALINNPIPATPVWIPVDIPVKGGARVDCSIDLVTAVTNGANVDILIAYE